MEKYNKIAASKLFIPGAQSDELSYVFLEPLKEQEYSSRAIFGIFQVRSTSDVFHNIIAQTVKNYIHFFQRTPAINSPQIGGQITSGEFIFENSLQYTNNQLSHYLREQQQFNGRTITFDAKRVSLILGLIWDNELYLCAAGKQVKSFYLYPSQCQQGLSHYGMIDILEGSETQVDTEPSSLFSQVITGNVSIPESTLIICNESFLDYIPKDQIKQAVTSYDNERLTPYFQNILGKANAHTDFGAIFINLSQKHESVSPQKQVVASHSSMEDLITKEKDTETILSPAVGSQIKGVVSASIRSMIVNPFSKMKGMISIEQVKVVTSSVTRFIPSKERISEGVKTVHSNAKKHGTSALQAMTIKAHQWKKKPYKEIVADLKTIGLERLKEGYAWIKTKIDPLSPVSKALLVIACLFLLVFVISIFSIKSDQSKKQLEKSYQNLIQSIEQKSDQAEASLIYEDESRAKTLVAEATTLLATLPKSNNDELVTFERLKNQVEATTRKISRILLVENPTVVAQLDGQIPTLDSLKLEASQDDYLLYNTDSVYTLNLATGKVLQINTQAKITSITCATGFDSHLIYLCGNENKLFALNTKEQSIKLVALTIDDKAIMSGLANYNNRLYVLDSENGSLTRHVKKSDGFGSGSDATRGKAELVKGAKSVSIDGSIYLITSTNQLTKITGTESATIPYPSMEPTLIAPAKAWSTAESLYLYLLDPSQKRVVVLDKRSNKVKAQITSEKFSQLKDMVVNEKRKELVMLNGAEVMKVPLEFLKQQ